jgi:transmembrane sensor
MSGTTPQSSDEVADAAGAWDARLRTSQCSAKERAEFEQWYGADPRHRAAFERLQGIFSELRVESGRADLRSLRDAALQTVRRRTRRLRLLAAAAFAGVALAVALPFLGRGAHSYVTEDGQRSTISLRDGSSLDLDPSSRADVVFTREQRLIVLVKGQALFRVAHESSRPFIVRAGDREIVAFGTEFGVRVARSSVRITLLEGKIAVRPQTGGGALSIAQESGSAMVGLTAANRTVFLAPGERFVASRPGGAQDGTSQDAQDPRSQDAVGDLALAAEATASLVGGRVFLDDLSLSDAVAEMNRYSHIQIEIADPALARLRVSGMFRAGEQAAFTTALESYFHIVAEHRGDTEIILRSR